MTESVLLESREDGIVTLTLNQPKLRNPISELLMIGAIASALLG